MKSVYCAVRTESLNKAVCASYLKGYTTIFFISSVVRMAEYTTIVRSHKNQLKLLKAYQLFPLAVNYISIGNSDISKFRTA